jgi:hypothetical protein
MNQLTKFLVDGILNEGEQKVLAAYGGGFKPPTTGHFEVVKQALKDHPEIEEFIIYVGSGERDGINQSQSILIWEIYQTYLPMKVKIQPSKEPIGDVLRLGKNNPQDKVYFVIGAREENEGDFEDIKNRTRAIGGKHPNMEVKVITTKNGGMSGTNARKASKVSFEDFSNFLPTELSDKEKEEVYNIVKPVVKEGLNENASYSQDIDIKQRIMQLTQHMLDKGYNIEPLPNVELIDGDSVNAREFLGKTAYYDPNSATIVLYTEGRHPKDIVRSFAHEMIHHIQNLEGRLGDVSTTNTMEDDNIDKLEQEANLKGTMTFRNWTDSLNENLTKNSNQIYHWTSYSACKKIIESNKLKSNEANQFFEYDESRILPDYKNVVFFTKEDERFADEENSNQCILVVDKSKLSEDYKVISYGDPYEETVVYTNDPSIPILPYLKGVILMNTLQKSAIKKMVEFLKSKGIPYEINDNLEKQVIAKKAMLPSLKKELINKLKLKYPNGFIGYLNTPLVGYQTPEYFKDNSTYSSPNITINKPGEYGEKNKFQVKFKIEPQNLEKYINWFMYSPDSIEDLIDMDNYEGEELWLKGNIPIDTTSLQEANLKGTMTFRNWTDSLNENILPQEKFAQEQNRDYIEQALKILPNKDKYNLKDYTVEILPIDKVKPTQFGEDYINASSEYEAEQYQKYIDGEISAEDLRREDFYPIVVDKDTMEILDGNHRHAVHTILSIPKIKAILVSKKLNKLNEIGDSSAKSYDYTLTLNSWYSVKYEFITDSDLNYVVLFDKSDDISDVVFYAQGLKSSTGSKFKATSNRGELFKIMSTVVKIVIDFLSKNSNINTLVIEPSKQDEGDDRRLNLYMQYIKNVIDPKEYDVKSNSKEIVISRKTNLEDMENVNEIIQENRIECKNCGWGWDMENGGEDPYICHKCGYDNSPLKEKKNKDQFGLNQYARELAQGLEEDEGEIRNIWRSQENTLSLPVVEPNKDMNYEIYSDMDGVLTDFDAQFMKASDGIPPSEYEKNFGKSGFWELIDGKGVGFWVGMPWMSDGKIYWDYIKKYNPILLSSPSRSQTSRLGKRLWVKNNMPGVKLILAQAKDKQNYAQKDRILIDDRPSNIDQWRASGGVGILHISASDTIRQLKELGI